MNPIEENIFSFVSHAQSCSMNTFITLRGVRPLVVKFLLKYLKKNFNIICIISGNVVCLKISFEIFLADFLADIQLRGVSFLGRGHVTSDF